MRLFKRAAPSMPPEGIARRTPAQLLAEHVALLGEIKRLCGFPDAHWQALTQTPIERFADWVQSLPASEAHHHAGLGGLLRHSLESTRNALRVRAGRILPMDEPPEVVAERQDRWTYAVAMAALLHDCAKPLTDVRVTLYAASGKALGEWQPWSSPMPSACAWYTVAYRRKRDYRFHQAAALLQAGRILPAAALAWLGDDAKAMAAWIDTLTGQEDAHNPITDIVRSADMRSVSEDLAGGFAVLPGTRAKPLAERLATGLRYLIDDGQLRLNAPGAAGWVAAGAVWLVVKTVLDRLREHLREEGHAGVPGDNNRLMDELQQWNVIEANGDKAIWSVSVALPGGWTAGPLTVLKVPLASLWPSSGRPEDVGATITGANDGAIAGAMAGADTGGNVAASSPPSAPSRAPVAAPSSPTNPKPPVATQPVSSPIAGIPMPTLAPVTPSTQPLADSLASTVNHNVTATPETAPSPSEAASPATTDDSGQDFLHWLVNGLTHQVLASNTPAARVHGVPGGVLIVSPRAFRDYQAATGVPWATAQKAFQKCRLHTKRDDGTNIWTYQVTGERKRGGQLRGFLIENPTACGLPAIPPNPYLALLEEGDVRASEGTAGAIPTTTPTENADPETDAVGAASTETGL